MHIDEVRQLIEKGVPQSQAEVVDLTGGGDHFAVTVTSPAFAGKSVVQQHKMIYAAVDEYMADERIHALSITTRVPK